MPGRMKSKWFNKPLCVMINKYFEHWGEFLNKRNYNFTMLLSSGNAESFLGVLSVDFAFF
jgi:hypothetical protein